jgi:hypothetical protein
MTCEHGTEYLVRTRASRVHPERTYVSCEKCRAGSVAKGMETKRRKGTDKTFTYAIRPRELGVQD